MAAELDLDDLAVRATTAAQTWAPGCADLRRAAAHRRRVEPDVHRAGDRRADRGRAHRAEGRAAGARAGPQPRRRPPGPAHACARRRARRAGPDRLLRGRRRAARGVAVPRHEHRPRRVPRADPHSTASRRAAAGARPRLRRGARCWRRSTASTRTRSASAREKRSSLEDEIKRWTRAFETVDERMNARYLEAEELLFDTMPPALPDAICHGDYRLGNMLCDGTDGRGAHRLGDLVAVRPPPRPRLVPLLHRRGEAPDGEQPGPDRHADGRRAARRVRRRIGRGAGRTSSGSTASSATRRRPRPRSS